MIRALFGITLYMMCAYDALAQYSLELIIRDEHTNEPLIGATVQLMGTTMGGSANAEGVVLITGIPDGRHRFQIRYVGYATTVLHISFPLHQPEPLIVLMHEEEEDLGDVLISSTRSSRTISRQPTRVEFIAGEELEEKSNMKSGDIRMLLSESTGIHIQQLSATSANASIRIQGLDGRYTQLLKDGFPLYAGAASGLGLLQTPPLDLKQVEVIKGSASTLYGGGAIAGLVNLISKKPGDERETLLHIDANSGRGYDANAFYSNRAEHLGTTVFASHHKSWAYDPSNVGLSAIPQYERLVFNPKLFVYGGKETQLSVGLTTAFEERLGGDMRVIQGKKDATHQFFEKNVTQRIASQTEFSRHVGHHYILQVKNSLSYFNRTISIPDYSFQGTQWASFSEATLTHLDGDTEWISGVNVWTDDFAEGRVASVDKRNYNQFISGAFVQHTLQASSTIHLQTGLRADYVAGFGTAILPRVSVLMNLSPSLSSRIGGGFGYKAPTLFTEESERMFYQHIQALVPEDLKLERSYGGNADLNFTTTFGDEGVFTLNQMVFYTRLNNPLVLENMGAGSWMFANAKGHIDTRGTETNMKIGLHDVSLFLGYTLTDTKYHEQNVQTVMPLTPRHRVNAVLMYEEHDEWRVGLESYYFSRQRLSDGATGKPFLIMGFMVERMWEGFSVYINFENFLDVRQARFDTIYTGTLTQPMFRDIYAPMDGFIINGGIKLRL